MERWKGKVAVVTGASAGIGAVIAEKLVCYGITVVGLARRIEKLEELAKKLKKRGNFFSYKTDVQNEEDVVGAFKWISEKFGQVHILINNAGVVKLAELTKCPSFELKESFNVNVFGLCFATREASKIMLDNKIDGHIIHISSIAGHNVLSAESGIYCASKHAVLVLAEALRKELTSKNSKIKISVSFYHINTSRYFLLFLIFYSA